MTSFKHLNDAKPRCMQWLIGLCLGLSTVPAFTQSAQTPTAPPTPTNVLPAIAAPQWSDLDSIQQQALSPLQKNWTELSDVQRRKWIAIIKNFSKLAPADQVKIQERMAAWASLKPIERERARENFASSKLAQPSTKMGSWEEYQALPQEERDKLASLAPKKRPGAAKNPKPGTKSSNTPPPTPPHPYPSPAERGDLRNLIAPNTLLPHNL